MAVAPDVSEVDLEGSAAGMRRGDTTGRLTITWMG